MGKFKERLLQRETDMAEGNWPELKHLKDDPLKWELLYYQLLGMVQEGRETARLISASPTVREFGECVFALFTPEGESIAFSRGILLHMASMGASIKWMLNNDYEEVMGINEGDIFYNNDPDIGGAHSADQAVLLPVFHEGELVGWVGGLTHCMEVGSTEPGGMSPGALSRYDDGQMVPCMRVGANDVFFPDFHIMVTRNTRDGSWWILDDRAKLAGCLKMKRALNQIIEKVGPDYFSEACYEMIESGRQFAFNRLKMVFFPGRYRSTAFYDIMNSKQPIRLPLDYMVAMPCETLVNKDGSLDIDWEGTSSAGFHSNNASLPCTLGNHIYTLLQDCLYDGFFNQGLAYSFNLNVPRGAVLNPEIDKACSVWITAVIAMTAGLSPIISRAYYANGYREEGFAGKPNTGGMFAGGLNKEGKQFAVFNFEANCAGSAAQSSMDGIGSALAVWNPEVNMSDCETFEHIWPLMWLGRGLWKDGGGYGRHRGGSGVESLYVVEHEPQHCESGCISSGDKVFCSPGLFGGYPGPTRYRYTYQNTNYKELIEKQLPLPHGEGNDPANPDFVKLMKGDLVQTPAQSTSRVFGHYDLIMQATGGGGGWGDPLEREIEAIENDYVDQLVSETQTPKVYKVAMDPETGKIDPAKTQVLRDEERKARLAKAVPAEQFIKAQREKILGGEISDIAKATLNDCFQNSERFLGEFKECWGLDEDFQALQ